MQYYYYYDYCEKELRALGKSLECCVCIRLMESPARTRWYACDDDFYYYAFSLSLSLSLSLSRVVLFENFEMSLAMSLCYYILFGT